MAFAVQFQHLKEIPGGGDRAVAHPDEFRRGVLLQTEQRNLPTRFAGRRFAGCDVSPGGDEHLPQTVFAQNFQRVVQCVSLGDAAQIQPHFRFRQLGGFCIPIQLERAIAGCLSRIFDDVLRRHSLESTGTPP